MRDPARMQDVLLSVPCMALVLQFHERTRPRSTVASDVVAHSLDSRPLAAQIVKG
jgi:hypothetical protein